MITKQIACEAELRIAAEFVRKGGEVFMPTTEDGPIDLVVYRKGKFSKIQVKSTKMKNNVLSVKLRTTNNWINKRYTSSDIDIIAVYDYESKKGYLLDLKDFEGMSEVTLRINPAKNNQKSYTRFARDYLFF